MQYHLLQMFLETKIRKLLNLWGKFQLNVIGAVSVPLVSDSDSGSVVTTGRTQKNTEVPSPSLKPTSGNKLIRIYLEFK